MARARLTLFGPPSALFDGEAVTLHRKSLALLAYMSIAGEPVARQTVAALFWPEASERNAATALRKSLWQIGRKLGQDMFESTAGSLSLAAGPQVLVDVLRFEVLLAACRLHDHGPESTCSECMSPLAEAVTLYRGDFLSGFAVSGCAEFDHWQMLHTERLRQALGGALDRLVQLHSGRGKLVEALDHARRRLELDPLLEAAHRQLMLVQVWMGQRNQALMQYDACVALIRDAFDAGPEPETSELAKAVRENRVLPPLDPSPPRGRRKPARTSSRDGRNEVERSTGTSQRRGESPPEPLTMPLLGGDAAPALEGRKRGRPRGAAPPGLSRLLSAVLHAPPGSSLPTAETQLAPEELRAIVSHRPADLTVYCLARIAEWSQPRHQLDRRFVALTLLIDRGEEALDGRWVAREQRYTDLRDVLADAAEPILVLLGPPGAGKTTLMGRLELEVAAERLRTRGLQIPFYVPLRAYHAPRVRGKQGPLQPPDRWLAGLWRDLYPYLPPLDRLLEEGRVLLLLDGLDEMPHLDHAEFRELVGHWKEFVHRIARVQGTQIVLACRSLDYSAPLSTPELRVPQIRVEPLTDQQVEAFVNAYLGPRADETWASVKDAPTLELLRTPYLMQLLVRQVRGGEGVPRDPAALFTGFIRASLQRELRRDNLLFQPPGVLSERDYKRLVQARGWPSPYSLPEEGPLFRSLSNLAHALQTGHPAREAAHIAVPYAEVRSLLGATEAEPLIEAAEALGLLNENVATDELQFAHRLMQEYFAARAMARDLESKLLEVPWRAAEIAPSVEELVSGSGSAALPVSETLPPRSRTGWDETVPMAALMAQDVDAFLHRVSAVNLVLAGHCAAMEGVRSRLEPDTIAELVEALVHRSRDPVADLRERVAAGLAVGQLGDPRFERKAGPHGEYLSPPLISFAAGEVRIGADDVFSYLGGELISHRPRHAVPVRSFWMGRFAVTNAEFACFVAAGAYDQEQWWDTPAARDWQRGIGTGEGSRAAVLYWRARFQQQPSMLAAQLEHGEMTPETHDLWQRRMAMQERELDAHVQDIAPDLRYTEPANWRDPNFNNPAQPVVGISWYEARAFCAWLSAQTDQCFRLPNEAEWEWAAAGSAGRRYGWGDHYDPCRANLTETRLRRTSPVGVFVTGDTPEGLSDMTGNTWDWTASLWGTDTAVATFGYPYDPADGREEPTAPPAVRRIVRGGAWVCSHVSARTAYRGKDHPFDRTNLHGLRLVRDGDWEKERARNA